MCNYTSSRILGGILFVGLMLGGCTDAEMSKLTSYGSKAHVRCFSGGTAVIDYHSTGKVLNEENSDGFYFKASEDGKSHSVSGTCDVSYE